MSNAVITEVVPQMESLSASLQQQVLDFIEW